MEHDRFGENKVMYIIGMVCMIISLSLFLFSIYILPVLLWNWSYSVPDYVIMWRENLRVYFGCSEFSAGGLLFLIMMVPALITGLVSHFISNAIDNQIYGIVKEEPEPVSTENKRAAFKESFSFSGKVIFLLVLVVLAVWFVEWILVPS